MTREKGLNGYIWTEKEIAYLLENYNGADSCEGIGLALDRSASSVKNKASKLGLTSKEGNRSKRWTAEELAYLDEHWGAKNCMEIAQGIQRTEESVRVKAIRLGYASFLASQDGISLSELADALNTNYRKVRSWTKGPQGRKRLRSSYVKVTGNRGYRLINLEYFWKWAKKNQDIIDFSRMEKNALGAEPSWVDESRLMTREVQAGVWTKEEEKKLIKLLESFQYTYSDIAELIGRSEKAIYEKTLSLNVKARPLKAERKDWTPNEEKTLLQAIEEQKDYSAIAKQLKRSETAVRGKYRKLKKVAL